MKEFTIRLDDEVAHILEVRSAIDNVRAAEGIERLLTFLAMEFKRLRDAA